MGAYCTPCARCAQNLYRRYRKLGPYPSCIALAYTVISAMAFSPYLWSCQDEKNPDCVMRLSNIVGV